MGQMADRNDGTRIAVQENGYAIGLNVGIVLMGSALNALARTRNSADGKESADPAHRFVDITGRRIGLSDGQKLMVAATRARFESPRDITSEGMDEVRVRIGEVRGVFSDFFSHLTDADEDDEDAPSQLISVDDPAVIESSTAYFRALGELRKQEMAPVQDSEKQKLTIIHHLRDIVTKATRLKPDDLIVVNGAIMLAEELGHEIPPEIAEKASPASVEQPAHFEEDAAEVAGLSPLEQGILAAIDRLAAEAQLDREQPIDPKSGSAPRIFRYKIELHVWKNTDPQAKLDDFNAAFRHLRTLGFLEGSTRGYRRIRV